MARKVAIQMDPVEDIDIDGDSTFVLGMEAQKRGYELYYYQPRDLSLRDGRVMARMQPLTLYRRAGDHHLLGERALRDLGDMDVVLLRQDPPFDMGYITTTHLLEMVPPGTLVVNDPASVRNAPEKLFVLQFPDLMPATTIASRIEDVQDFRDKYRDIIIKPLYGNGGAGVFHLKPDDENLSALMELFASQFPEPVIAQEYLPAVREGDKRIILIDGEPAGAINRVPQEGEARSNMHVGGTALADRLNERDREICARIGPELRRRGLIFVGIDVIGGLLTEINVTSPTGLQEINRFDNVCLEARIWDAIERRLEERGR